MAVSKAKRKAVSRKIKTLLEEGKPHDQAVAMSMRMHDMPKPKKMMGKMGGKRH